MKIPFSAVIFDMDDTLAMTAPLWREAETHLLSALGHLWTPELAIRYKGMRAADAADVIHRALQPELPPAACRCILRDRLIHNFQHMPLDPAPGSLACLQAFHGQIPLALASGSPLAAIDLVLDRFAFRPFFDAVLTTEDIARGKPAPDIFLAAADALAVPPSQCLVIEDSAIGARAAQAAGMTCYVVPSGNPADLEGLATRTFPRLDQIPSAAAITTP